MIRYVLIPLLPLAASRLLLINQQKAKEKRITGAKKNVSKFIKNINK